MKTFILAVIIPAFIAAILFSFAEYIDSRALYVADVTAAWVIAAYVVIFLAIHFSKKENWFRKIFKI